MSTHEDRLGLRFYIDTNFVTDPSDAATALRTLYNDGWIELIRTDTMDTELRDAKDPAKRSDLLRQSNAYVESFGPLVLGHSRLDFAVLGNDDDGERLAQVYGILFPGSDRFDASMGRAGRKIRDAMHVATAIRYGANGLITLDGRDLLSKSEAIAAAFNDFKIMTPETALAFVQRMRGRYERRKIANE
jgi:hypothetical protein